MKPICKLICQLSKYLRIDVCPIFGAKRVLRATLEFPLTEQAHNLDIHSKSRYSFLTSLKNFQSLSLYQNNSGSGYNAYVTPWVKQIRKMSAKVICQRWNWKARRAQSSVLRRRLERACGNQTGTALQETAGWRSHWDAAAFIVCILWKYVLSNCLTSQKY